MMTSCDYRVSTIDNDDWVSIMLDARIARPYLEQLRKIAIAMEHDHIDADDTEVAMAHFDFAVNVIDTIHRLDAEQKEKKGGAA